MNILIVDDDIDFSNRLKTDVEHILKTMDNHLNFYILNDYFNRIKTGEEYDIAFLDIDLQTVSGIELGAKLRKRFPDIILIYVSAKDDLVFQTLSTGVYQFIRKVNYEADKKLVFNQLKEKLLNSQIRLLTINKRLEPVHLSNITYITALGKDVVISEKQDLMLRSSIKDVLLQLDYPFLIQIQRSTVVNCNYIKNIQGNKLYTKDNREHVIGKKYMEHTHDMYGRYLLK